MMIVIAAAVAASASIGATAKGADITSDLPYGETGLCAAERRGTGVLPWKGATTVTMPDGSRVRVDTRTRTLRDGVTEVRSTLTAPPGTVWRGLPVTRLETAMRQIPESHAIQDVAITFPVSGERLQRALGRHVAAAPAWTAYDDERLEPHGGAERIERVAGGVRLVCRQTF